MQACADLCRPLKGLCRSLQAYTGFFKGEVRPEIDPIFYRLKWKSSVIRVEQKKTYNYYFQDKPLHAGMFLSDEPGYYEDGAFGIRIESIILTKDVKLKHNNDEKGFLCFEPVTLVPIQQVCKGPSTKFD